MQRRTTPDRAVGVAAQLVVAACAASAGAHAGLVPEHLSAEPRLGAAFLVAAALLLAGALALAARPLDRRRALGVTALFAGLIGAYAASRTTGIPLLAPDPEAVEVVGLFTNAVEVFGLVLALWLAHASPGRDRRRTPMEVSR